MIIDGAAVVFRFLKLLFADLSSIQMNYLLQVLAEKLKSYTEPNSNQFVTLSNFLTGEAKLEQYLQEHPPLRNPGTGMF